MSIDKRRMHLYCAAFCRLVAGMEGGTNPLPTRSMKQGSGPQILEQSVKETQMVETRDQAKTLTENEAAIVTLLSGNSTGNSAVQQEVQQTISLVTKTGMEMNFLAEDAADDNEVMTYLKHVAREATRVMKCFSSKRIPSDTLQQCMCIHFGHSRFIQLLVLCVHSFTM